MKIFAERNSVRFKGEIPLEIKHGTGITRDFSSCGLYFFTDQQICLGETLELVMLLEHQNLGQMVRLRCEADVVRVEPECDRFGVAVAITRHLVDTARDTPAGRT
ncbi:PilZ domain-containing protein [Geomonas subterranea]|uniref:PilZ domain-containing protein n=1 Tax=Geomonas subterranea TaxID=2847989 RepID=A0ABX8LNW9_9BACT|nr:PilZ domain-containing protein [Geomonas subterranea]QXE92395.1 PilZ domain-containing protein [Geomonas subterranea]QXM09506.1 PilZ domain-containing protein [Geomonas subterranea]